ncbi:AcrR family transcriptional regulator [Paenibacillus sp. DS2015]|uniref:TetR/AcrR family transcriptional regulator n=1 Tax=Paenibacillus sp. DS2015 TaxID=3373917 RepID=UPI003D1A16CD
MTSKQKIQKVALAHFAKDGFEGTSLRKVAEEVGIRKPSIYAHFKGKDDLFLEVLKLALVEEKHRIKRYFLNNRHQELAMQLKGLLYFLQEEYALEGESKFVLRMSFFPPTHLYDEVMQLVYPFLESLEDSLAKLLAQTSEQNDLMLYSTKNIAIAYMTLIDGITIEIIYGGFSKSEKRIEAAWPIFWAGIHYIKSHQE